MWQLRMPKLRGTPIACPLRRLVARSGVWPSVTTPPRRCGRAAPAAIPLMVPLQAVGSLHLMLPSEAAAAMGDGRGSPRQRRRRASVLAGRRPALPGGLFPRGSGAKQQTLISAAAASTASGADSSSDAEPDSRRAPPGQSGSHASEGSRHSRSGRRQSLAGQPAAADGPRGSPATHHLPRGRGESSAGAAASGGGDGRASSNWIRGRREAPRSYREASGPGPGYAPGGGTDSRTGSGTGAPASSSSSSYAVSSDRRGAGGAGRGSSSGGSSARSGGSPAPAQGTRRGSTHHTGRSADGAAPALGGRAEGGPRPLSTSQRVARLRKPALTAADKLGLEPQERARIFRQLRTRGYSGCMAAATHG
jgi:hypothetical protein